MILAHADDAGMDVTVTSTHGRSGTNRYANGNVAEKVVRLADPPYRRSAEPTPEEGFGARYAPSIQCVR